MKATSVQFEGLAFAGWGEEVEGWLMRSNYLITRKSADRRPACAWALPSAGAIRPSLGSPARRRWSRARTSRPGSPPCGGSSRSNDPKLEPDRFCAERLVRLLETLLRSGRG